jgi:hypothetical protein
MFSVIRDNIAILENVNMDVITRQVVRMVNIAIYQIILVKKSKVVKLHVEIVNIAILPMVNVSRNAAKLMIIVQLMNIVAKMVDVSRNAKVNVTRNAKLMIIVILGIIVLNRVNVSRNAKLIMIVQLILIVLNRVNVWHVRITVRNVKHHYYGINVVKEKENVIIHSVKSH